MNFPLSRVKQTLSETIDVPGLKKGDRIPKSKVEQILGFTKRSNPELYNLKMLTLLKEIDRRLQEVGKVYFLKCSKGAIVICDDEDAITVGIARCDSGVRKIKDSHFRLNHVDLGEVAETSRQRHHSAVLRYGQTLAHVPKTRAVSMG